MVHVIPHCGFSRTYVIEGSDGLAVVDVGSVGAAKDVLAYIGKTPGLAVELVRFITATHFHIDHIGGIGHLLKKCPPETEVVFHGCVKDYLKGRRGISTISNWRVGLMPATLLSARYIRRPSHLLFESLSGIPLPLLRNIASIPCPANRIRYLEDRPGRRYGLGFDAWEVMETPGHTEDSICFFNEPASELICGDLILNMKEGGSGRINRFYWNRDCIERSYAYLCESVKPRSIYPGHGEVIRHDTNALPGVEMLK
jgi:glyoxylase-like metal-dependent hydrolase (beta-lactamase superfamily II)